MGPYPLATLVLFAFFPFAFVVFKRLPPAKATAFVVLAGSLFLPEIATLPEMPVIPTFEKEKVTYVASLLAILTYHRQRFASSRAGLGPEALFLLVMLGFLGTIAMNMEPIVSNGALREGLGVYWFLARSTDDFMIFVVPFIVGRAMFRSADDLKTLLYYIAGAGLIYTVLIGIEALMSIPFHVWQLSQVIYGIAIRPMWRWGYIQPLVFMENGLSIASFMALAVLSAVALIKAKLKPTWRGIKRARVILLGGLLMTWNVAGIVYGYTLTAAMMFVGGKGIARIAVLLALLTCVYPMLRIADLFPDTRLVELAQGFDADRARSLKGRFDEEDFVLGNIGDRLLVGWGMFDRIPGVLTFGDGETGLDSFWVIRTGLTGIFGVEILFLMLALPVLTAWRKAKLQANERVGILLSALMACVAIRMIDLLLNGLWNSLPFFLAGALHGLAKSIGPGNRAYPGRNAESPRTG